MIGVRMHVAAAGVVTEFRRPVTDERAALEDDQRFVTRPIGAGRDDAHVGEMAKRRQISGGEGDTVGSYQIRLSHDAPAVATFASSIC